jgi:cytoskeletal protein CcmA (bactofilin family)
MAFGRGGKGTGGGGNGADKSSDATLTRRATDRARDHARAGGAMVSVIGPDFTVTGDIVDKGVLKVYGNLEGNVICRALTVEESGAIEGDIRADTISVSGSCDGHINARVLVINKTARVDGKVIVHESMSVQPPARFEGACRRGTPRDERKKPVDLAVFDKVREDLGAPPSSATPANSANPASPGPPAPPERSA